MKEKMYLSLVGHDHDRPELDQMITQAEGDVEAFRRAYKKRFLCAAMLESEAETEKFEGEYIPVN